MRRKNCGNNTKRHHNMMGRPVMRGFTLIELLVVISIIALLVAILMPALAKAKEQAKTSYCLMNQKTLAQAFTMYASNNEDKVVSSWTSIGAKGNSWVTGPISSNGVDLEGHMRGIRAGALYPYIETVEIYRCPSDRRDKPSVPINKRAYRTYSMPNCIDGEAGGWTLTNVGNRDLVTKTTQIRHPASKYVFLEESDPRGMNSGSWVMSLHKEAWIDPLTVWHDDKSTLGFADGHAEIHQWFEQETIDMSKNQQFWVNCPGSRDWKYMHDGWQNNKTN